MSYLSTNFPGQMARNAALILAGVALMLPGCDINMSISGVKGSGVMTTKSFDLESFESIRFSGAGQYNIQCGEAQTVSVSFDDNLMEFVELKVENGKLRFDVSESYSSSEGLTVDVTVPKLTEVRLLGAGTANVSGVSGETLSLDISGASKINADGTIDRLEIESSGACSINTLKLEAKTCSVDISGAGSARVNVTDKLDAKLSGVGTVKYQGDPEVTENVSGVGSVSKMD